MTGVVIGDDAVADALYPVADDEHTRRREKSDCGKRHKLCPYLIGELVDKSCGGGYRSHRKNDQHRYQHGVHAAEGVVISRKAKKEQYKADERERSGNYGDRQVQAKALFLSFSHFYCLLSLRSNTMVKAVNAIKPNALMPTMTSNITTHQT